MPLLMAGMPEGLMPYLPSAQWFGKWLRGENPRIERREAARCLIMQPGGEILTLSVPIAGGAKALKTKKTEELYLSDHGDWRKVHAGALNACYSRTPFGEFLVPDLVGIISEPFSTLAQLNSAILSYLSSFLGLETLPRPLPAEEAFVRGCRGRVEEIAGKIRPEISVVDALARLGREAILPMIFTC